MKIKSIALAMVFLYAATAGQAQEKLSLSVEEAVEYALKNNLTMDNARLAVSEANRKIWETTAQGLPQLDATVDYSNFLGAEMEFSFDENMPPMVRKFNPTSNLKFTASQLIFSGSYLVGLQTAKLYKELTEVQFRQSGLNLRESVRKSYYLALMAERSKDIVQRNLSNLDETYQKTEALVRVGIADKYDLDQLEIQRSMVGQSVKAADRQLETSYNMLRAQLGLNADADLELTDSLENILNEVNNATVAVSIAENLDYQLMKSQEEISKKQVGLEKAALLPSVAGFYSYTEKILKPEVDFSPKSILGIQVTVPIFSSGMRKSRIDQANIRLQTTRNNISLLEDQLEIQERQLRFDLANAQEQYEIRKRNIEVAKNVYENFERKYAQGMASSLDLTTANNNYLQAESGYIQTAMQLLDAGTALLKLYNGL